MLWIDRTEEDIQQKLADQIAAGTLIVRDEKTASGRVHIGSMRGVAIHGAIADALKQKGIDTTFLYEINDFDPMDDVPPQLGADWNKYLGLPLCKVPSPDGKAKNFAEYYAEEFMGVIKEAGFTPSYYRASELYASGRMNDAIKTVLEHAEDIRRIYKEVSGSQKADAWLPIAMVCEKCGKVGTTKATSFDGEKVVYECVAGAGGAVGCGHAGAVSPYNGNAKLPWKPEWAAKWKVLGVHIEGAGKDHSTKGGARDVANTIAREVFKMEPPYDMPYEFFLDKDGKKMSSSKGRGATSRDVADVLPTHVFRLALLGRDPMQALSVDPNGDAIPFLWDWHDKLAEKYWQGIADDDSRLFEVVYDGKPPAHMYLPRFSSVAFIVQMPHIPLENGVAAMKGSELTPEEMEELTIRAEYTKRWITAYASDKYKFTLQKDTVPTLALSLSDIQKTALKEILAYIQSHDALTGAELHAELHRVKEAVGISPKELFGALYQAFLGRDSGPQAGWFLATLDRDFVVARLTQVV